MEELCWLACGLLCLESICSDPLAELETLHDTPSLVTAPEGNKIE
jgi:hypothetical protein